MDYPHNDKIKKVLEGCAPMVEEQGLNHLIPCWQNTVEKEIDSQSLIWEEYVNELDGRHLIELVIDVLDEKELALVQERLIPLDTLFKEKTHEVKENLWGSENEFKNKWNRSKNWYYYRAPQWMIEADKLQTMD